MIDFEKTIDEIIEAAHHRREMEVIKEQAGQRKINHSVWGRELRTYCIPLFGAGRSAGCSFL